LAKPLFSVLGALDDCREDGVESPTSCVLGTVASWWGCAGGGGGGGGGHIGVIEKDDTYFLVYIMVGKIVTIP
jgi:hypothetical protein